MMSRGTYMFTRSLLLMALVLGLGLIFQKFDPKKAAELGGLTQIFWIALPLLPLYSNSMYKDYKAKMERKEKEVKEKEEKE